MKSVALKKEEAELIRREKIFDVEDKIKEIEGSFQGDNVICPLKHTFADGIYVREIRIPAGMLITGKIHKHSHPNFLMSGTVDVYTESGGHERLTGPLSMISPPGTKRALYSVTDLCWITVHYNPDNTQDLDKLEDIVIAKDYAQYDKFRKKRKFLSFIRKILFLK